ncbi:MAG: response regulator transcription factor [Actinobacteria bacterium]|nr:response regulator transcription factor [Actinomycetota bacterium]MCL5883641.1 response regulator transcription factor [Actinomycetota bacterium]
MSKIRILLADDHAILRAGLVRLLGEEKDIEVVGEAENGREAVQKVQELHPDIVLMDIGMPVMNGMEATKQIKKRDQDVKILVLTMHDNEEYLFQVLQAGAAGYVLKKAADSDLVNAIHVVSRGDCFLYPSAAKMVVEDYLEKLRHGQEPTSSYDTLTDREREILTHVAEGYTNREIAESLFISVKTVETHKANIMEKLNLHKRAELVKYAIKKGMLQVDFDEVLE